MDPEHILQAILAEPDAKSDKVGFLANRLLSEYHRGYPLENLRPLLRSTDERSLDTGIFIASELGPKGKPLLHDVAPLLRHASRMVRYQAVECIWLWAGPADGHEIASAILLLEDTEPGIRRTVMNFLAAASRGQLEAALTHFEPERPVSDHVRGLRWLLGPEAIKVEAVVAALRSKDSLARKYAAVAAFWISKSDRAPLICASSLQDPDVKRFADSCLALL